MDQKEPQIPSDTDQKHLHLSRTDGDDIDAFDRALASILNGEDDREGLESQLREHENIHRYNK